MSESLTLPTGRLPWWYPTRPRIVILFLVLAVIGGVAWWVWISTHCASGVRRVGGECVGVTDGSFVFSPDLADVLGRIRDENRWVEQQGEPFVSIAYLVALPGEGNDPSDIYRHELQGAYLAQRRANRTNELGDLPLIRLLVANAGEDNEQWRPVVAQLGDRVRSERLVAVAGLGVSLETTRQAIAALTAPENPDIAVPVIAARLTSDDFSGVPRFVRVAPTDRDQAQAMVAYLKREPAFRRALLIQDINETDLFVRTLGEAFTAEFPDATHNLLQPVERYDGSLPGLASRFVQMMADICQQRPDVIYFAGRGEPLRSFIQALPERPCLDLHVTVVTGDSGGAVATALRHANEEGERALKAGLGANMALRYTELAHPDAWAAAPGSFPPRAVGYLQENVAGFPDESLDDGGTIMGHDAVVTAVRAIRSAVAGGQDLMIDAITPRDVIQALNGLHGTRAVPGASGWISLDVGDPVNKAIPILELQPDGTVAFLTLSAAGGTPFIPPSSSELETQG
ncbi:MAG: ABC transporter substrate-binding protein [Egibacteraceae bacterium]